MDGTAAGEPKPSLMGAGTMPSATVGLNPLSQQPRPTQRFEPSSSLTEGRASFNGQVQYRPHSRDGDCPRLGRLRVGLEFVEYPPLGGGLGDPYRLQLKLNF